MAVSRPNKEDYMITSDEVDAIILHALGTINDERAPEDRMVVSLATPLFGPDSAVDSLDFVSLIVDVETSLNVDHGLSISLADDFAESRAQSPFSTVETLREYILTLAAGQ
jgi:acyl carrier protein